MKRIQTLHVTLFRTEFQTTPKKLKKVAAEDSDPRDPPKSIVPLLVLVFRKKPPVLRVEELGEGGFKLVSSCVQSSHIFSTKTCKLVFKLENKHKIRDHLRKQDLLTGQAQPPPWLYLPPNPRLEEIITPSQKQKTEDHAEDQQALGHDLRAKYHWYS